VARNDRRKHVRRNALRHRHRTQYFLRERADFRCQTRLRAERIRIIGRNPLCGMHLKIPGPRLLKAFACAQELGIDPWQFSLHGFQVGVDQSNLRWLVLNGYAEHGEETTTFRDDCRRFRRGRNILYTPRSDEGT
jgi:hypothetical protein